MADLAFVNAPLATGNLRASSHAELGNVQIELQADSPSVEG
eukprot:CAMPEP_0183403148 /NCGR_PEP_ID=MMETSP0370-20130417/14387_1 /TAXON_ID=268820 /ORGANISM="Peridinium aciculiferum, Strain PAER-2" /LENGTH=40 /DNA_ID= /DNA_START= /DNA_END= /DNA_ORIENTATION=